MLSAMTAEVHEQVIEKARGYLQQSAVCVSLCAQLKSAYKEFAPYYGAAE